jgi:hypothetical protein
MLLGPGFEMDLNAPETEGSGFKGYRRRYHGDMIEIFPFEDEIVTEPRVLGILLKKSPINHHIPVNLVECCKTGGQHKQNQ